MAAEIHIGDIGTEFVITLYDSTTILDVSGASVTIYLKKPSGTTLTKAASLYTDGTDGKVKVSSASGDLDEGGLWTVQAKVAESGNTWYSDVGRFRVHANV